MDANKSCEEFDQYLALHKAKVNYISLYYELAITFSEVTIEDAIPPMLQSSDNLDYLSNKPQVPLDWPRIKTYIPLSILVFAN